MAELIIRNPSVMATKTQLEVSEVLNGKKKFEDTDLEELKDPKYWHNSENFIPKRFENNSIDFKGNHFEFIPFGAGRRICPRMLFGLANVGHPLAQLLYHFDWKLPPEVSLDDFDMTEAEGVTASRKNHFCLIATPSGLS
ncbi:hypothetical protein HAX54_040950 [Datura stramonium]|uniref:Cytochrome P450 n=1 Tax=Datura stramonium TaxID=4076 RepID=A0ABS8VTF5_DATST|nr:hypothetical protein [Datura stramonium]